jgi:hypothetical protein
VTEHPTSSQGLVLALIDPTYQTLAGPPSFESCTRDVYSSDLKLSPATALAIARGVASAAQHLHARHIHHGDLYAHNILWRADGESHCHGHCYLNDFGAAAFYPPAHSTALQRLEARAFGCLLEELIAHTHWTPASHALKATVQALRHACLTPHPHDRPSFTDLTEALAAV